MGDSLRAQLFKFVLMLGGIFALVGAILRFFFIDVVIVSNDAMAPTIFAGDTVLAWRSSEFKHGSIVLCRHPQNQERFVIGRIVGKPGMQLSMQNEQLMINNERIPRDFQGHFEHEDQQSGNARVRYVYGIERLGENEHLIMERPERNISMRPVTRLSGLYLLSDNRTWNG
ncbi:MAG: signal peptidase I, partial [Deltaproteobacteria bacterium]|nr:signal peptidase I [Deltaproteobacteria bacterium]